MSTLSKLYSNDRTKLYELKNINNKVNTLLDYIYLLVYNKKSAKQSIIENAKVCENIKIFNKIIDNTFITLVKTNDQLDDSFGDIHNKLKNKKYYGVLDIFSKILRNIIKLLNNTFTNNPNKKTLVITKLIKKPLVVIKLIKKLQ